MIAHTNDFKNELFSFARQYKNKIGVYETLMLATQNDNNIITENNDLIIAKISNNDISYEITDKNIFSIKLINKGELLSTLMKELDFESDLNLDAGNVIDYKFGIKVNNDYEYLDYGKFIVYKKEYQNDKKTYLYTCYDFMLKSMVEVGNEFDFLTTPDGDDFLVKICDIIGIDFDRSLTEQDGTTPTPYGMIKNKTYPINVAPIKEAKTTYRDLLNMLCQYFGVSMYMDNNDLKIKLLGDIVNDGGTWKVDNENPTIVDTIDNTPFKDTNIVFKDVYGRINALNVSGTDETKTSYVEDATSVASDGVTLFEVKNNLILNDTTYWNDYSANITNNIFELIDGVSFNLCDTATYGIMYLQWLDYFGVTVNNRSYKCLLLNSEITVKDGIGELIYTEQPEKNVSEYTTSPKSNDVIGDTIRARGNAYANGERLLQETDRENLQIKNQNVYSGNETIIGTWINGETLYRKVLYFNDTVSTNVTFSKSHGISNGKIIMIKYAGFYNPTNGNSVPLGTPGFQGSFTDQTYVNADRDVIWIRSTSGWGTGWYKVFILEYTKNS